MGIVNVKREKCNQMRCIFLIYCSFISIKEKKTLYKKKNICAVYGYGTIAENIVFMWFGRFSRGKLDLEDGERSGRTAAVDDQTVIKKLSTSNDMRPH